MLHSQRGHFLWNPLIGRGYSERHAESDKASLVLWVALLATVLESAPKQTRVIAASSWQYTMAECQTCSAAAQGCRDGANVSTPTPAPCQLLVSNRKEVRVS